MANDEPIVVEHVTSRSETVDDHGGEAELFYHVLNCESPLAARQAVAREAPPEYHGLGRGKMELEPKGGGIFAIKQKYSDFQTQKSINWDYMAEKSKTMKAKETIANIRVRYGPNFFDPAPDYRNLIGVSKDKIEGVEIYDPDSPGKITMQWTTKYAKLPSQGYLKICKRMRGHVNQDPLILEYEGQIYEFGVGSLVFVGYTFHSTTDHSVDITFKFEDRESESEIRVGDLDGMTVATFDGTITTSVNVVTGIASTAELHAGMIITGSGIPAGATIHEVLDATSIELTEVATLDGTVSLTAKNPYLPTKEGWWYVWLRTVKVRSDVSGIVGVEIDVPDTAHMVRVYDYGDFGLLEVFDVINLQSTQPPVLVPSKEPFIPSNLEEEQLEEADEQGYRPLPPGFGETGGPIA